MSVPIDPKALLRFADALADMDFMTPLMRFEAIRTFARAMAADEPGDEATAMEETAVEAA